MLKHLVSKGFSEKELSNRLHCILPTKNQGLSETNELLEKSINSSKTERIQI